MQVRNFFSLVFAPVVNLFGKIFKKPGTLLTDGSNSIQNKQPKIRYHYFVAYIIPKNNGESGFTVGHITVKRSHLLSADNFEELIECINKSGVKNLVITSITRLK